VGASAQVERPAGAGGRYRLLVRNDTLASVPAVASWASPLLWLLFVALLLILAHLLLKYCAIAWPGTVADLRHALINYCEAPRVVAGLPPPDNRQAGLLQRMRDLERQLDDKRRACVPERQAERPAPPARPPVGPDLGARRDAARGQTGAVNVILGWESDDDLDLHLTCPDHVSRIYFNNRQACGGVLDVDQQAGSSRSATPVENIFFVEAGQVPGTYLVEVHRFASRSSGTASTPFKVELRINNVVVETHEGQAVDGDRKRVFEFTLPYVRRDNATPERSGR